MKNDTNKYHLFKGVFCYDYILHLLRPSPSNLFRIYCEQNYLTMVGLNDLKMYIMLYKTTFSNLH